MPRAEPEEEDEIEDSPEPTPSGPLLTDVSERNDPVGSDARRYQRFGNWLERVQSDDED
jgi:hypothetical protein